MRQFKLNRWIIEIEVSDGLVTAHKPGTWGRNQNGQLGNGKLTDSPLPVQVIGPSHSIGSEIIAIDANAWYSLALDADGTVYYWGTGYWSSRYMTPGTLSAAAPFPDSLWENNLSISAGYDHVTSRKVGWNSKHDAFAWGRLRSTNKGIDYSTHPPMGIGGDVTDTAAGYRHSLMLHSSGTVSETIFEFYYYFNQGGFTSEYYNWNTGLTNIKAISSKHHDRLALSHSGQVWAWAWTPEGEGDLKSGPDIPGYVTNGIIPITGIGNVEYISAGALYSYAVVDGVVWEWSNHVIYKDIN